MDRIRDRVLRPIAERVAQGRRLDAADALALHATTGLIGLCVLRRGAETNAVKAVFGQHARDLMFASTKSMTGHTLGAAGAIEAVISLLVTSRGEIPPTINQDDPDSECDLHCVPNVMRRRNVRVALSNSFGFGGHNATLAVRAV